MGGREKLRARPFCAVACRSLPVVVERTAQARVENFELTTLILTNGNLEGIGREKLLARPSGRAIRLGLPVVLKSAVGIDIEDFQALISIQTYRQPRLICLGSAKEFRCLPSAVGRRLPNVINTTVPSDVKDLNALIAVATN